MELCHSDANILITARSNAKLVRVFRTQLRESEHQQAVKQAEHDRAPTTNENAFPFTQIAIIDLKLHKICELEVFLSRKQNRVKQC